MNFEYFFSLLLGGLTRGSIYALIALGYTMVYGIIKLINFAHGEIYMIGAFTALIIGGALAMTGMNPVLIFVIASLAAIIYSAAYGVTIDETGLPSLEKGSPLVGAYLCYRYVNLSAELCTSGSDIGFPSLSETSSGAEVP